MSERPIPVESDQARSVPRLRVEPPKGVVSLELGEIWNYREIVGFLVWRDLKVRYRQTWLGVTWVVIQPLFTMVIFSVIFGRVANLPSEGVPYPVFTLAGLLPWQLLSSAVTAASGSVVSNANLLTKVYFPRLVMPVAAVLSSLVDFAISFVILLALMVFYRVSPGLPTLAIVPLVALTLSVALAVGLWSAALNVKYRDVRYAMPFLLQIWLFVSPVAYSASLVPEGLWRTIYMFNPMAGVIQGWRWALFGTAPASHGVMTSALVTAVVLVGGLVYFRRAEHSFADIV